MRTAFFFQVLYFVFFSSYSASAELLSHKPGVAYEIKQFCYMYGGQTIPGTQTVVDRVGWYESPVAAQSDQGDDLYDNGLTFTDSIVTNYWLDLHKRVEIIFDLKDIYEIEQVEVWVSCGDRSGNFIKNGDIYYGLQGAAGETWDKVIAYENPYPNAAGQPVEYAISKTINEPARYVRIDCRSDSAQMIIGEIKIFGTSSDVTPPAPLSPDLRRFEIESLGNLPQWNDRFFFGGSACYITDFVEADLVLPTSNSYYVWVRYLDNGLRTMRVGLNGIYKQLPVQSEGTYWNWFRVGAVNGPNVKITYDLTGSVDSVIDSTIFTPSASFYPNSITSHGQIASIEQIFQPLGFASQWLIDHPENSTAEWIEAVRVHYGLPSPEPSIRKIDQYGNILLNGTPFFPVGIFHASYTDLRLNDAEFNAWHGWPGPDFQNEDFVAVPTYSSMWRAYDVIVQMLLTKRDQDRVLMHYICDEPENVGLTDIELDRLNALVQMCDPAKSTFVNFVGGYPSALHMIPDVVGIDYYPISSPGQSVAQVSNVIEAAKTASNNKPIVFIAQSFSWEGYDRIGARWPMPAEVRAMTYLALIHNAKGLWFYEWPSPFMSSLTCMADTNPELWTDMKIMLNEVKTITPALLGPEVVVPYMVMPVQPSDQSPEFRVVVTADLKKAYLLCAWPYDTSEATVRLDFRNGHLSDIDFNGPLSNQFVAVTKISPGVFEFRFIAMGSGVFNIISNQLSNLVLIGNGPICGDQNHRYLKADLNFDCSVDMADFAIMASHWLHCTNCN